MSEDKVYNDGDIVWVKLGNNWWPGEVTGPARHPEGLINHLKRVPYCVVKFFNENTYEYVRSSKQIFPFQCAKQDEFIRKGYSLYNSGNSFMEKFPTDVEVAKQLTRRKESSLVINDRPDSIVKAILGQPLIRTCDKYYEDTEYREQRRSGDSVTKILNITPSCNSYALSSESNKTETSNTSNPPKDKTKNVTNSAANNSNNYQCHMCDFTSVRLNVLILHRKMHSNRNAMASSYSASSAPSNVKPPASGAPTQQNTSVNKDKHIIKTKVNTIATAATRRDKTLSPTKITTKTVAVIKETNTEIDAMGNSVKHLTSKGKGIRTKNLAPSTEKLKTAEKSMGKKKKEENAYATILSDFCPSETEMSPSTEEKHSRRSLRHCKNLSENIAREVSTICIDLSEPKVIQKIPKKREYSSLKLQSESLLQKTPPVVLTDPDVVCLGDNEKGTTSIVTAKADAEDIRRMLLADWSDDDETPTESIVVDDTIVVENVESNECVFTPVIEQHVSSVLPVTAMPVAKPTAGRIRNIPKKDRRDVVLQDFNSDLSIIQSDNTNHAEHATKTVAVDLDSSNSSVVEIIEDKQPAAIITINDDEEQEKNQIDLSASESKDNDSAVELGNDKTASTATSSTTLSCFDFQEDEEEPDNGTTTISHFKKKYLSVDKLQNLASATTDQLREDDTVANQAEMAEKDQRLAAEIESLLEQTQTPVADLINANSFDESISVKDLPIKERGKRIFKSRNKTRQEDKTNAEIVAANSAKVISSKDAEITDEYKTNEIPSPDTDILDDDREMNEPELESNREKEIDTITDEENLINKNCLTEISSQDILLNTHAEISKYMEEKQLKPNENKENEDLQRNKNNCLEDCVVSDTCRDEEIEKADLVTSDKKNENTENVESATESITAQQKCYESSNGLSKQLLNDQVVAIQRKQAEKSKSQNSLFTIDEAQKIPEQVPHNISVTEEDTEENDKNDHQEQEVVPINEVSLEVDDKKMFEAALLQQPDPKKVEKRDEEDVAKNIEVSDIPKIGLSQDKLKVDSITDTLISESPKEIASPNSESSKKELNNLMSEENDSSDHNKNQEEFLENIFKIRVKSPDQLFEQSYVMGSQQEQDVQRAVDSNVDERLITATPTDENSSMGASDTGAEFGSPTSMLSEERLPAFRFQSNQTPQPEVETAETEFQMYNTSEMNAEERNLPVAKSNATDKAKDSFLIDKSPMLDLKLQQRRFSMNFDSLQGEPKRVKRQRLSVDGIPACQEKSSEKPREFPKILTIPQSTNDLKVRPKSRHMKITPRRNVSELFKVQTSLSSPVQSDAPKSGLVESVDEHLTIKSKATTKDKQPKGNDDNIDLNNENSNTIPKDLLDNITEPMQLEVNLKITGDNTVLSETIKNKDLENPTDKEDLKGIYEKPQDNVKKSMSVEKVACTKNREVSSPKVAPQTESETELCPAKATDSQENTQNVLFDRNNTINVKRKIRATENKSIEVESPDKKIVSGKKHTENIDITPVEIAIISVEEIGYGQGNHSTECITLSLDTNKTQKEQVLEAPYSPGVPPPTPQEREVIIESDNIIQALNNQQETEPNIENENENETEITIFPLTPKQKDCLNETNDLPLVLPEKHQDANELDDRVGTPKENELLVEECPLTPLEKENNNDQIIHPTIPETEKPVSIYESTTDCSTPHESLDVVIELQNSVVMTKENIDNECGTGMPTQSEPQNKNTIIECEPSTAQAIIECEHKIHAQASSEKLVVESHKPLANSTQDRDIIIEENIPLDEKETLLAKEFQDIQPKENSNSVELPHESHTNILQTDADKAAEEFLIEFDSIVNHSHAVEEDPPTSSVEAAINTDDLISNIIEEVHEDQPVKQDAPSGSPVQYEPMTYTVVTPKNSWNQIFKDSFKTQLPPAKRRQTICFELSNTKEGVACKKQALDFESILPVNKTIKRTAERKLTLPAIESKLSNNAQSHNIIALNHNQLTLNKKIIPATKRKLSIEDNITSFIIQRPKQPQQATNSASGPPPLQRVKPISRHGNTTAKGTIENLIETPPIQSNDLFQELFPAESSSPSSDNDINQKPEGARVIHQQIITPSTISSIPQNKTADVTKMSKNKQIGVDSRGNKYVIIKTPPTDIVVQPTLTSTTASAVTATNNFGTTITIQPLPRSTNELNITKPTSKTKNISSAATSSRKQQLQQQQMKQISITVPAQSPLEAPEATARTHPRNRRKTTQSKVVAATTSANSNINSAKHRQAMEALSRRLSIAAEAPPLSKIGRTSTTHVQTQISNNSNLTFFGDTQISNIAQQQFIQLQQQQHQHQQQPIQAATVPQPPPIILNKNAHQHTVIKRRTRKISQQLQQQPQQPQQQPLLQHQQQITPAKSSQLLQQQQQNQMQQQQLIQQQFIAQITTPQQQQQPHNLLQPPPLQQIQSHTIPMQQQIIQQSDGIIITTAPEEDNVIDSMQLIALPTQPYPGYSETFLLCKVKDNTCKPVDNVPLYLNRQLNELMPVPLEAIEAGHKTQGNPIEIKASNPPQQLLTSQDNETQETDGNLQLANINCNLVESDIPTGIEVDSQMHHHNQQQQIMEDCVVDDNNAGNNQISNFSSNQEVNTELVSNNGILLNIEGQQVLLDAATFAHLLANPDANTQLISDDGTEYVLTHEVLAALQMQQEQQQALELANAAVVVEQQQQQQQLEQTGGSDIIAVALAGSDLYENEVLTIDTSQGMQLIEGDGSIVFPSQTGAIAQQHLTPPAVVTNAVLDQSPIMSALEVPSSIATTHKLQGTHIITVPSHHLATSSNAALGVGARANLEDSLAAIGVTTQSSSISASLGLPITVTNPNIASKVTSAGPLNEMLQFVSHRPVTAAATAAAVAAAALAGESRIFND